MVATVACVADVERQYQKSEEPMPDKSYTFPQSAVEVITKEDGTQLHFTRSQIPPYPDRRNNANLKAQSPTVSSGGGVVGTDSTVWRD